MPAAAATPLDSPLDGPMGGTHQAQPAMPRVGLLGGSFNPPHLAHRALGQLAMQALALDELRWLPVGQPWQKAGMVLAPAQHRIDMLAALLGDAPGQVIDDRECRRAGPTYTLDTVRELQAERPQATYFLILGQDQFARFDTWHGWAELVQRVTLAVAGRAGNPPVPPPAFAELAAHPARWVALDLPPLDISASTIRRLLAAGPPQAARVATLVGPAVAGYIDRHQLYTQGTTEGTGT